MGFRGGELSTVLWPQELPEPSIAASGAGTSVTAMPELPSGVYFLDVSDHGAPMLAEPTPAHACPWRIAILTTR